MDQRLQEMLDHYEITKTLKDYCHGCDRCDVEQMAGVYMEDGWDDHGAVSMPGRDFAPFMIGRIHAETKSLFHMLGQSMIRVDGDEAGAETYFLAVSHAEASDGVKLCNQLGGRFVDTLQRVDGRWLIKHRIVVRDWSISMPVEQDWVDRAGLAASHRSTADASYAALKMVHSGDRAAQGQG